MKKLLLESGIQFDEDGFIRIPEWVRRVKIDVGLSDGAPQSAQWFEQENDLLVFGFEPNHHNARVLKARESNWSVTLNPNRINQSFYLIECALSNVTQLELTPFYYTSNDPGCSSLLIPNEFPVGEVAMVQTWSLNHFLHYFPFHKIPYIDYVKTDCQGMDVHVIEGCSKFLEKIAIFTCEADDTRYQGSSENTLENISKIFSNHKFFQYKKYMGTSSKVIGPRLKYVNTEDPTFINSRLRNFIAKNKVRAFQKG